MSSPPPASPPMVWPPSNPSGTVIPFPLPWGQTGCCPPGGMDALMKCYCDIQQASAFIGQVMLDQINNNPAIIAAIIAGIEKSGSSLPLIGVTNGQPAQPGQVGEFLVFDQTASLPSGSGTTNVTMGVLPPGDWVCQAVVYPSAGPAFTELMYVLNPVPAGFSNSMLTGLLTMTGSLASLITPVAQALISVPTLVNFLITTTVSAADLMPISFVALRVR